MLKQMIEMMPKLVHKGWHKSYLYWISRYFVSKVVINILILLEGFANLKYSVNSLIYVADIISYKILAYFCMQDEFPASGSSWFFSKMHTD